jgi:hypothetical protein
MRLPALAIAVGPSIAHSRAAMKKTLPQKPLVLTTETVRTLKAEQLPAIDGGKKCESLSRPGHACPTITQEPP